MVSFQTNGSTLEIILKPPASTGPLYEVSGVEGENGTQSTAMTPILLPSSPPKDPADDLGTNALQQTPPDEPGGNRSGVVPSDKLPLHLKYILAQLEVEGLAGSGGSGGGHQGQGSGVKTGRAILLPSSRALKHRPVLLNNQNRRKGRLLPPPPPPPLFQYYVKGPLSPLGGVTGHGPHIHWVG